MPHKEEKSEIGNMNALECKFPPPDPMTRELAKIGHYSKYTKVSWGGIMPEGVDGSFLLDIAERLKPEYKKLLNTDPALEAEKIASYVMDKK